MPDDYNVNELRDLYCGFLHKQAGHLPPAGQAAHVEAHLLATIANVRSLGGPAAGAMLFESAARILRADAAKPVAVNAGMQAFADEISDRWMTRLAGVVDGQDRARRDLEVNGMLAAAAASLSQIFGAEAAALSCEQMAGDLRAHAGSSRHQAGGTVN